MGVSLQLSVTEPSLGLILAGTYRGQHDTNLVSWETSRTSLSVPGGEFGKGIVHGSKDLALNGLKRLYQV